MKKRFVRMNAHVNFDEGGTIGAMAQAATSETTTTERILFYTGASGFKIGDLHDNATAAWNGLQFAAELRRQPDVSSSRPAAQPASGVSNERRSDQEHSHVVAWDQSPILLLFSWVRKYFWAGAQSRASESLKSFEGPISSDGQRHALIETERPVVRVHAHGRQFVGIGLLLDQGRRRCRPTRTTLGQARHGLLDEFQVARMYKTRTQATYACDAGRVQVNGQPVLHSGARRFELLPRQEEAKLRV